MFFLYYFLITKFFLQDKNLFDTIKNKKDFNFPITDRYSFQAF